MQLPVDAPIMQTITIKIRKNSKRINDAGSTVYTCVGEGVTMATAVLTALANDVDLSHSDLQRADLRNVNLCGANLYNVNLSHSDLSHSDLRGANLSHASLMSANLSGADLYKAQLQGASLYKANLQGVDLSGKDLSDTNFSFSNLRDADLQGADLRGADLSEANLAQADLTGANLVGVNFGDFYPSVKNLIQLLRVPDLDGQILRKIESRPALLSKNYNHDGEAHSRLGWAVTLAGPAGAAVQMIWGIYVAGPLIYAASYPRLPVPDFSITEEETIADLRMRAALAI